MQTRLAKKRTPYTNTPDNNEDQKPSENDADQDKPLTKLTTPHIFQHFPDQEDIKMSRETPPHKDPEHYTTFNFMLKMPQLVKGSIAELDETGSNYLVWKNDLYVLVNYLTKIKDYLDEDRCDTPGDDVIVLMIRNSVCPNLRLHIDESESAFTVFGKIKSMFHFPSRTTHISIWQDLLKCTVDSPSDIPAHINRMKSKVEELQRTGFSFTKDSLLGILMQLGLPHAFSSINTVLDARLRGNPDASISARETEEAIRAETHRLSSNAADDYPNVAALNINNSQQSFGTKSRFQSPRRDVPDSRDVYRPPHHTTPSPTQTKPSFRITENTPAHLQRCFDCGNKGHWAKSPQCPNPTSHRGESPSQGSTRGSYRANLADANHLSPLPNAVYSSEGSLTEDWGKDDGILDTGATHHVTNEVSALIDYSPLHHPIPLHVATESTANFLTGIGSLVTQSDLGEPSLIKRVYYCEKAKGTLISVAGLVEEGACFSSIGKNMCIVLCCHTITSKYKQHRWLIPVHEPITTKATTPTPPSVSACDTFTTEQSCEALK